MFNKIKLIYSGAILFILGSLIVPAYAGKITNLTMNPSTPNFGDVVTVDFDYCVSNNAGRIMMAVSSFPSLQLSQTVGQVFVLSDAGINVPTLGKPAGTEFAYLPGAVAGAACTDCTSNAGQQKHFSMKINIPNANMFPGCNVTALHLYIAERDYYMASNEWTSSSGCSLNSLSWTIGKPPAQFSIHKRAQGVVSVVNDLLLYSIDYTYGNGKLVITDPLPANLQIVSVGPASIATVNAGTITWTLPDKTNLPGISSGTVWFLCKLTAIPAGPTIDNTATGSMPLSGLPNQTSSVSSAVGQVTMSVKKSYGPPGGNFNPGDVVTYYLDYQVSGSKLGAYESFDEMTIGASYSNASPPPGWKFQPFSGTVTGTWNVMNPCGTGDNYIQATAGAFQYPGLLLNSANPNFCTGEIMVDTEIEGTFSGADTQIIVRNNGLAGAANYSVGLILSQDATPAYLGFQTVCCGGGPQYPGANWNTSLAQLNKWYSVLIKVTQPTATNDYLYQAKAWPRGDPIPSNWMATYTQTNGAIDPNWSCASGDWRPGFNQQSGDDGSIKDSFDNFVVLNPFTSSNTTLYDTVPAGITYAGSYGSPATTSPMVRWDMGPVADQVGSYTWWGTIAGSCGQISNTSAMNGTGLVPVFSNDVVINVSCGTATFTPTPTATKTATPTASQTVSPTAPGTFTNTPTITPSPSITPTRTDTRTPTDTPTVTQSPTPAPADLVITLVPIDTCVKAGDIAEISVVVTNAGQERADGFTITVNLPNATLATFNLVDPDGATIAANALWTHTGNTLTRVILAPINPGEQQTFVFYITTAAGLPSGTKIDLPAETADYNLYPAPVPAVPATATSNISFITVGDIVVYPNPFNPKTAVNGACKFANLPKNTRITIFTLSGEMVQSFRNQTAIVTWNGTNMSKKPVSPGIYYYIITWNDGVNKMVGKIFLMRQ